MTVQSITADTFFNGQIRVKQDRTGYRFSIDAVLLAYHADPRPGDTVVDLGTGCGVIPLILVYRSPKIKVFGIEVQKELADMAVRNVEENSMDDRISILHKDIKALKHNVVNGPVDLVVSNPPFRRAKSGRLNSNRQRAVARHEIKVTLNDVVESAHRLLRVSGRLVVIYPAERMTDIISHMRFAGIEPKFLRTIHSGCHAEAKRILLEGIKGGRPGIKIDPSLIICRQDGSYTDEVSEMLAP